MKLLVRNGMPQVGVVTVPVQGVGGIFSTVESWFTGYDREALQQQSAELDAKLAALNEQARTTGTVDAATYQDTVNHIAAQIAETAAQGEQIDQAYVEGVVEGYQNELGALEAIPQYAGKLTGDVLGAVTRGVSGGVGSIGKGIFGNLPWWVWVGGAAALFFYFGGGQVLKHQAGKVARRYSTD